MSDKQRIFDYLVTHRGWNNVLDMMARLKPAAINWAVRSRISDLNKEFAQQKKPYKILQRIGRNRNADYILVEVDSNNENQLVFGEDC